MSLLALETALERLLESAVPIAAIERVPLAEAAGRVFAEDIVARRTQPAFAASAMDGYALPRAAGRGETFALLGVSAAGTAFDGRLEAGMAVRVFTGAPLPEGTATVVIQENVERLDETRIRLTEEAGAGLNMRPAGNDFAAGTVLVRKGDTVTAGRLALAASGGFAELALVRRPRVAILATGDELVPPGAPLGASQIVASNGYGVAAIVTANGGTVLDLGITRDDEAEIAQRVAEGVAAKVDILVTIGGASVGDRDLTAGVLRASGVDLAFWKIAMRPGKPLMAGRLGTTHVLGLPGNPSSAMVTASVFLRPLVRRLAGLPGICMREGVLGRDVPANDHRAEFMRAVLRDNPGGPPSIEPLPRQDSSLLSLFSAADVLLFRPTEAAPGRAGERCHFVPLD